MFCVCLALRVSVEWTKIDWKSLQVYILVCFFLSKSKIWFDWRSIRWTWLEKCCNNLEFWIMNKSFFGSFWKIIKKKEGTRNYMRIYEAYWIKHLDLGEADANICTIENSTMTTTQQSERQKIQSKFLKKSLFLVFFFFF